MKWKQVLTSSVGRKYVMALTGLFLIVFLVVHAYVNVNVLFENGEENFNRAANFMSTNVVIRIMEFGLFAGFIIHIYQGYLLNMQNRARRSQKYSIDAPSKTSTWYSRSMTLLGTLILLFLIVHIANFWVPSRFGGLEEVSYSNLETHNLYAKMKDVFSNPLLVLLYLVGCFSLAWHLLHGFQSAFQTMGWKHRRYAGAVERAGLIFSIVVPLIFAMMPVFTYFGWELPFGNLTLFF